MIETKQFDLDVRSLTFGALIGMVELVDVKDYEECDDSEWLKDQPKHLAGSEYASSLKGFILKNPKRLAKPILWKGQLNFFDVDDKVANSLRIKL